MIDERILKFLHDNCLDLVGINLAPHSVKLSVFIKKQGGSLVVGRAMKGMQGTEDDLMRAIHDAFQQMKLIADFDAVMEPQSGPEI